MQRPCIPFGKVVVYIASLYRSFSFFKEKKFVNSCMVDKYGVYNIDNNDYSYVAGAFYVCKHSLFNILGGGEGMGLRFPPPLWIHPCFVQ